MKKELLLGEIEFPFCPFADLETTLDEFRHPSFLNSAERKKFRKINSSLLSLIEKEKEGSFLLPQVIDFIGKVNEAKILQESYTFSSFEFWLNRFGKLSEEDNLKIRAKIVGKSIPRSEYGIYFPISSGKSFYGAHFIAAHMAPDVDSTIASFWGWVDAFGAKVAQGIHHWSLPGELPESHLTFLFRSLFGKSVFQTVARSAPTLTLSAMDLLTQKDMVKVHVDTHSSIIEQSHVGKAVILIDDHEHYRGDWRSADSEQVRNISMLFASTIRWFEHMIHSKLINTFAKKEIYLNDIQGAILPLFDAQIRSADPVKDFSEKNKKYLNDYLKKILCLEKGIQSHFHEVWLAIDPLTDGKFSTFWKAIESLFDKSLFDKKEKLIEDRPVIFSRIEKILGDLDNLIFTLRTRIDQLSMMVDVKDKVLNLPPQFVTLKSDVDEIKTKIGTLEYLTVVIPDSNGKWFPVGIVHANDLKRPVLGTCSLRDFSNRQETQAASYLEVISVVDHHKTSLETSSAPCFYITDAQSSNTLLGEMAISINNRYSLLGVEKKELSDSIESCSKKIDLICDMKKLSRLLQLKINSHQTKDFYISPHREFVEYLAFLYAILDDTDLLSKVSDRDVRCVAHLLNRMKSIAQQEEVEIISLDDICQDSKFAQAAAKRILQNKDMYSIYSKIYEYKEQEMERHLSSCVAGGPCIIFADTKEQNGCCRVGQTKIFHSNYQFFESYAEGLRTLWWNEAKKANEVKPALDFHLHMISTIPGAKEVYSGHYGHWKHQDEMWFWVAPTQQGYDRLVHFLNGFHQTESVQNNVMEVEFLGPNYRSLATIFAQNFPKAVQKEPTEEPQGLPIAVLKFRAGSINSRKAQVSPYLPRFVP